MEQFHLFPPEAANTARQVDLLFFALTGVSLFFVAIIFLPLIFFAIKYRRGSEANRANPSSGSVFLESGWTLFPLVLAIALFCWGAQTYYKMERPPADALQVKVGGKQWIWKWQHAEEKRRSTSCTCRLDARLR